MSCLEYSLAKRAIVCVHWRVRSIIFVPCLCKVTYKAINSCLIEVVLKIIINSPFHLGLEKCTSDFVFLSMKPPCIMCVQYIGGYSVHRGDTMSTLGGYYEYIGEVS